MLASHSNFLNGSQSQNNTNNGEIMSRNYNSTGGNILGDQSIVGRSDGNVGSMNGYRKYIRSSYIIIYTQN